MGASNPHPHGQIWATDSLGTIAAREDRQQRDYHERYGTASFCLRLCAEQEGQIGDRCVLENANWLVVVPYWAVWPFETLLLPKSSLRRLPDWTMNSGMTWRAYLKRCS